MDKNIKYDKMKSLLEEKLRESSNLESKINWLETYLQMCSEDKNINTKLIDDSKKDIDNFYLEKGDKMYHYELPYDFMEKNKEELNWSEISRSQDLTTEFIIRNKELIDFKNLSIQNYFKLDIDDMKDIINMGENDFNGPINWSAISMREDLKIEFIRKFKDHLNWKSLSINCDFTEDQLVEFMDYIDWKMAVICQNYSDDFKDKYDLDEYIDGLKETGSNKFEERERIYERISSEVENAREYASERG
jgi:hypothetical protein